jgi:2-polyprenyl-3-methyl-5-hydroxy-6-metoxy-1,4-benzoquinol methylase
MESSPWRQPYLADLTYGGMYHLVQSFVPRPKLRILEVGCGGGFLSLELAREGHDVLGIDLDPGLIKTARRVMSTDPYKSERGTLEYTVSDFASWKNQAKLFDLVILSRVLHHIPQPDRVLEKVQRLLTSRGRIICIEYAYDLFERRSAAWFYHIRRVLEQAGWFASNKRVSDNIQVSVDQILEEWQAHARKWHLNRFKEMHKPLRKLFSERHFSWQSYIFWDIIMHMRIPSLETEMAFARSLAAMEKALIDNNAISPVQFCFVGDIVKGP